MISPFKQSVHIEAIRHHLITNYEKLTHKYTNKKYIDTNEELIGNTHFGISIDLYKKMYGEVPQFPKRDLAYSFIQPLYEDVRPTPDWRSVDGTSGSWKRKVVCKGHTDKIFVTSIRKLSKFTAIDFDFCRLFTNHWFCYCADYENDNVKRNYPVFAHNKDTNKIDGYIFPVREYGRK